ncbi:MAG: transposase, partial [Caldilineaceae bacterium]|nr:transposase [Caldilineaceae bacterium]
YAYIVFEVPVDHPDVCPPAEAGAVGVDRNVGQATDSTGAVHALPDTTVTTVEDAQSKRYPRRMARQQKGSHRRRGTAGKLRKLHRRQTRRRDTATHQVSRKIADTA